MAEHEQDEALIKDVIKVVESGWNSGNGEAFAAPFAEHADYVPPNGQRDQGRDRIAAGHQHIFSTIYKGSRITYDIESIRFIRTDVALAHAKHHLQFEHNGSPREAWSRSLWILAKDEGRWQVEAFHNTMIVSPQEYMSRLDAGGHS